MLLARLGVAMSEEKRAALFADADKDGSGSIDVDELGAFLEATPVESDTSTTARAVRAGLVAQFYASAFHKSLAGVVSAGSAMHRLDLGLDLNGGCAAEEAATVITMLADQDASRLAPELEGKESAVMLTIGLDAGTDREAVQAFFDMVSKEVAHPVEASFGTEADGEVEFRIMAELPAGSDMLSKLEVLRMVSEGVEQRVRVFSRSPLSALLYEEVPLMKAGLRVELGGTIGANVLGSLAAMVPAAAALGGLAPSSIAVNTGFDVAKALGKEDETDEELIAGQERMKGLKEFRSIRKMFGDDAVPKDDGPTPEIFLRGIRSVRSVHATVMGVVVTVEIAGGQFRVAPE